MKTVSRFLAPLLASTALLAAQNTSAAPTWQINPSGTGVGGAFPVSTAETSGVGFVQITPSAAAFGSFHFVEFGAYQVLQPGTSLPFSGTDMTVAYEVHGSGNLLDPTALRFSSGIITLYADAIHDFGTDGGHYGADNGTLVARFNVFGGGVYPSGLVGMNAMMEASSLLAGYLFAADGRDLANSHGTRIELSISNQTIVPDALLVSEVVCEMAGYLGPCCDGTGAEFVNSPFAFTVHDGGFATVIAAELPEPETAVLLLTGLVALVRFRPGERRQRKDILPA